MFTRIRIFSWIVAVAFMTVVAASANAKIDAVTDVFTAFKGQKLVITFGNLLSNDVCVVTPGKPCKGSLNVTKLHFAGLQGGSIRVVGRKIIFRPSPKFASYYGNFTLFKYTVTSRNGLRRDGLVRINVAASPS